MVIGSIQKNILSCVSSWSHFFDCWKDANCLRFSFNNCLHL